MARALPDDALRAVRLRAQLLVEPATSVTDVVARVAIQAQAAPAARLAVRVRSTGLTAADVDAAGEGRRVVRTWAMRGTLHMLPTADVRWIVGLLGPVFARAGRRRREQLGLDENTCERALSALARILADGPLTRAHVVDRLAAEGVKLDPSTQAPAHLLAYAAHRGLICRGPDAGKNEATYPLLDDWTSTVRENTPDDPLAELARRYLRGHPAATPSDFTAWSGLPAADGREAFDSLGEQLARVGPGYALASTDLEPPAACPPRLLGAFDAYLLGFRSRGLILDTAHAKKIQTGGGMIPPAVLAAGRLVGTWKLSRSAKSLGISVSPFAQLPPRVRTGLEAEADDIGRFLGTSATLTIGRP